jgi:hypothetical protein
MLEKFKKFNDYVAIKMTLGFGSMNAFWILFIMVLIPLIPLFSKTMPTIQFISSGIIQLIALPLILVGQNLMGESSEKRAQEDHEMLKQQTEVILEQFDQIKHIHNLNKNSIEEIKDMHKDLHQLISVIKAYVEVIHEEQPKSRKKNFSPTSTEIVK